MSKFHKNSCKIDNIFHLQSSIVVFPHLFAEQESMIASETCSCERKSLVILGEVSTFFHSPYPQTSCSLVAADEKGAKLPWILHLRSWLWRYLDRGIPYRRGYLLHGPPGCGKSVAPDLLDNVKNAESDFFSIHGKWSIAPYEHSQTVVDVGRLAGIEGDHHWYLYILIWYDHNMIPIWYFTALSCFPASPTYPPRFETSR